MTKDEMNDLLAQAVSKYALMIGVSSTEKIIKKLDLSSESKALKAKEKDAFLNARNALMECGKVLLEDRNESRVEGIIYAGAANMNPSIVVACVDGDTITVMAYAKEGLIKQKTAKKAIERFEKML